MAKRLPFNRVAKFFDAVRNGIYVKFRRIGEDAELGANCGSLLLVVRRRMNGKFYWAIVNQTDYDSEREAVHDLMASLNIVPDDNPNDEFRNS